ncbi:MAG: HAD family hydrolase [Bacteroidota bacterium]
MIEAVLFDMDGVLVDSEDYICEAAILMFQKYGVDVRPADFKPFIGRGEDIYLGEVAKKYGVNFRIKNAKARTYAIYDELVAGRLQPLNGVYDFIARCKSKGLKMAVATSADETKMHINLRELKLEEGTFDALIHGLMVKNKKPLPDIYLMAAEAVGCDPSVCLVVEDAVNGVQSAKKAGAKCLALTSSFSPAALKEADWICKDLSDVPEDVLNW